MADNDRKMDRKAVFEPYDMDTAIGTNNSGVLMFSPYLEDTDTVDSVISGGDSGGSNAPVYNAQDSVIWNNLRDAFRGELTQMYRSLRASKVWSYEEVERRFEAHQAIWPEAIFNEDSYVKYLTPLVDPVTVDEDTGELIKTDRYLTMLQGSKEEQRKWWLFNRFRYLDSKYDTGNASSNIINIRFFNEGVLKFKMAIPGYAAVSFGGGTTPSIARVDAGEEVSFPYVAPTGVTEMETWIHSGNLVTDISDLSVFYPNECDFSKATLLRRLKIGDATEGYSNANLTTLNVQNSPLLEYLDVRNCPRLGITLNLENSPRLAEAYFDGTTITGVDLADGCVIETLHLPSTVTALTLLNLSKLSEFVLPDYSNITRLMLANMDMTVVPLMDILEGIPANSQVNIQGLYLELSDSEEINEFYDLLDTMTGVTRERNPATGEWVYHSEERANVSGEIHTAVLTGEEIEELNGRYPYVRATADHTTCYIYYYNYDGTQLLYTETVLDGRNGYYSGTPERTADPRYTYTFAGWSTIPNGPVDSNAQIAITRNRNVYAAYTAVGQKYTVRFYDDDGSLVSPKTLLQTVSNVLYGATAQYTGTIPVHPTDPENNEFIGWYPSNENITGNTDCYPAWLYTGIATRRIIDNTIKGRYENSLAKTIGQFAFYRCSRLSMAVFPEVSEIKQTAFSGCTNLKSVICPNVLDIEYGAFTDCINIETVSFPKLQAITSGLFKSCLLVSAIFPSASMIGDGAFYNCSLLSEISFPNVVNITYQAFYGCRLLSEVFFPNATSIGASAFAACSNLMSISFPNVTFIGSRAFVGCRNLARVSFPEASVIFEFGFAECSALSEVSFPKVKNVNTNCFTRCSSLATAVFPEVVSLSDYGFYDCQNLSVALFPKLTFMYSFAFGYCYSLQTVSFPEVTYIGTGAFLRCSSLASISFPKAVEICSQAFKLCSVLSTLVIGTEQSSICVLNDASAITDANSSVTIYVPESLVSDYQVATNWTLLSSRIKAITELPA